MYAYIWGPAAWRVLHGLAFSVPSPRGHNVVKLAKHMAVVLPCSTCRTACAEHMRPPTPLQVLETDAVAYCYVLHEMVNNRIHANKKPSERPCKQSALLLAQLRKRCEASHALGMTYFSADDIALVLSMFAACCHALADQPLVYAQRRRDLLLFIQELGTCLSMCRDIHEKPIFSALARACMTINLPYDVDIVTVVAEVLQVRANDIVRAGDVCRA